MPTATVRDEARRLVEQLPDDATWNDVLDQVYVRQSVEAGLDDCRAGRGSPPPPRANVVSVTPPVGFR